MSKALNKSDIVEFIQKKNGYSLKKSVDSVESLLEIIKGSLESGEDVLISGFGKFQVRDKRERKGRNPATGEDMMIIPRRIVTFKCSGRLKDKINDDR